jgi:quercetin dioxygenase-like cupin family protein
MRRVVLSSVFIVLAIAFIPRIAAQSAAVSINNEPHHKRLLYTNDLRLWDVVLAPGQSTPPFLHEYDVATIVIGDGTLTVQRNGETEAAPSPNARGSVIVAEHTGLPATYHIENSGTTEYRAFEVENMHDAGKWAAASPFTAPGSSVLKDNRAFTVYDLTLKAGDPPAMHPHMGAVIVMLISGTLELVGIGGEEPVRIQQPGQWLVLPRFQSHTVAAIGGDTHAVEIEVR